MPIIKKDEWHKAVAINQDPYGNAIINTAREVMRLLDGEDEFKSDELICRAAKNVDVNGITGFMVGAVAAMVSHVHSRGDEFRRKWNLETQLQNEGERANEKPGAVLNPAMLCMEAK